jgi:transposase
MKNQLEEVQFIMTKFTTEERLAAVLEVEAGETLASVGKRHQMSPQVISRSLGLYRLYGETGLSSRGRKWSTEDRLRILKYMHDNHLSCKETSIQFGISGSCTVWEWDRKYLEKGASGLEDKKKEPKSRVRKPKPPMTRLEELEEENLNLRIENEYLKKLHALVTEREKRERENR